MALQEKNRFCRFDKCLAMETKLWIDCTKIQISRGQFVSLNLFASFFYFQGSFQILERNTWLFNPSNQLTFRQLTSCSSIRNCSESTRAATSLDPGLFSSCWSKAFQPVLIASNTVHRCLIAVASSLICSKINNRLKTTKSLTFEILTSCKIYLVSTANLVPIVDLTCSIALVRLVAMSWFS